MVDIDIGCGVAVGSEPVVERSSLLLLLAAYCAHPNLSCLSPLSIADIQQKRRWKRMPSRAIVPRSILLSVIKLFQARLSISLSPLV